MKRAFQILLIICMFVINQTSYTQSRSSEGMKRNAMALMREGKYGEAIDIFNKYIVANPRLAEGYHLRGLCHEQRSSYPASILDLRRAVSLEPSNGQIKADLARITADWHQQLYVKIEGYKREIAIDPSNPFNYLEIGKANAHLHLEEYPTAEYWYDEYLKRDDNASPDEIIRYTLILQETGHIKKGEKILKKYTERYPEDWRIWSRYGYFTLWLGKYAVARKAFENALTFKPFFKEAQDGLDLAKKQGYVTQYQSDILDKSFQQEYPIDRLYRLVKNNPADDESRFSLIQELINAGRYEEAYQQALVLQPNYSENERFTNLWDEITRVRDYEFNQKLDSALIELRNDPNNGQAAMDIARYYSGLENYDGAIEILTEYLDLQPKDDKAMYLLARIYTYNHQFDEGYEQVNKAIEENPTNTDYKLLAGQLATWMNYDYNVANNNLTDVIDVEPNNIDALITLGTLNFSNQFYEQSESYANRAAAIDPANPDVQQLQSMIEMYKLRAAEDAKIERLNEGRELAQDGNCDDAIPYYEEYLSEFAPTDELRTELADIYMCAKRWDDALAEYDTLLQNGSDYTLEKQRAKVYYWMGDSLTALDEFERLSAEDPGDMEAQLYLGDSYTKMHRYDEARKIYESLEDTAPDSYMIQQRLDWLPAEENFLSGIGGYLMSYMFLSPTAYYFNDNLDFEYMYAGSGIEIGVFPWLSAGATYLRGVLGNQWGRLNYTTFKGNIFIHPAKNWNISFGYGKMYTPGVIDQKVWDAQIKYEVKDQHKFALSYLRSNAAVILYSPSLVGNSLAAHSILADGYYNINKGTRFEVYYQFLITDKTVTDPQNIGNTFNLKISKLFWPEIRIGYEFEFTDYKYDSNLYWTPDRYSHHALWGEWEILNDGIFDFKVGGKIGYVPRNDYILRAAWAKFGYKILPTLTLAANANVGSTVRDIVGYSSGSFNINLFCTIF